MNTKVKRNQEPIFSSIKLLFSFTLLRFVEIEKTVVIGGVESRYFPFTIDGCVSRGCRG